MSQKNSNNHDVITGKLSVRERIALLVDEDSFLEIGALRKPDPVMHYFGHEAISCAGDAVVVGQATIHQRQVCVYAQDFTQLGGSLGRAHAQKIVYIMNVALQQGCPLIGIIDSGGARIQEGIASLEGYAEIFKKNVEASGRIPQISVILGPCAGGASYSPALTDFIFMVEDLSSLFITGPKVIETVTGQQTDLFELGGSTVHSTKSGVAHFVYDSEKNCLAGVRKLLMYLPQNYSQNQVVLPFEDSKDRLTNTLAELVPKNPHKPYDMHAVLQEVVDQGSFFEISKHFAPNIIIGFATLHDRVVGIVANQTSYLAGCLDIASSDKIARFVRFCDCFNIPLLNFVDSPGYLPGVEQEHEGIIRHGAKVLYAYAQASVPKIALILRKAFGGAYIALAGKGLGYDVTLAWPSASIAVMGPEQAVNILYTKEIQASSHPEKLVEKKVAEYEKKYMQPSTAAELGYIDSIITSEQTRIQLIQHVERLRNKQIIPQQKKHGNIPL